jgi:hypothetical protein
LSSENGKYRIGGIAGLKFSSQRMRGNVVSSLLLVGFESRDEDGIEVGARIGWGRYTGHDSCGEMGGWSDPPAPSLAPALVSNTTLTTPPPPRAGQHISFFTFPFLSILLLTFATQLWHKLLCISCATYSNQ